MHCLIIGAAPAAGFPQGKSPPETSAPNLIICADGGYIHAGRLGLVPDIIMGDFDSAEQPAAHAGTEVVAVSAHKDDTDMLLCIKEAIRRGADSIAILGGLGGRLSHTMANISALQYCYNRGIAASLLDEYHTVFVSSRTDIPPHTAFSLFPLENQAVITIKNAEYPLDKATVTRESSLCASNKSLKHTAEVISNGPLVIILEV